ncbi:hypothetical protein HQ576_19265 [bacterium]|nr:hypothetical protein [bacterium]
MAVTGTIGAGNQPGVHRARILLYDKDGKPLAEIPCASNTGLENITFGPDGMIYTVRLKKVSLLSADDKLLEQVDWASCRHVDVTPDGKGK